MPEMQQLDDEVIEFLHEVKPVVVGTRRRDGSVHLTPAWYEWRDGSLWMNSWRGARWLEHIERERVATLLFADPTDSIRVVEMQVRVTGISEDGVLEHADRLSHRYTGGPYRSPVPQQRVTIRLEPTRTRNTLAFARQLAAARRASD